MKRNTRRTSPGGRQLPPCSAYLAHGLDRVEAEPAREHRQSPGECLLLIGKQVVAPVEGKPKRLMPSVVPTRQPVPSQHRGQVAETGGEVGEAQGTKPPRRQLDSEWDPVKGAANLHNGTHIFVAYIQMGSDGPGPVE